MRRVLVLALLALAGCTGPEAAPPDAATTTTTTTVATTPAPAPPAALPPEPDVGPAAPLDVLRDPSFDEGDAWRVQANGSAERACDEGCRMRLPARAWTTQAQALPPEAAGGLATLTVRHRADGAASLLVELGFEMPWGEVERSEATLRPGDAWADAAAFHARVPLDAARVTVTLRGMGGTTEVDEARLAVASRPALARNGGFERGEGDDAPGWAVAGAARACGDLPPGLHGDCALRLHDATRATATQTVALPPGAREVLVFATLRAHDGDERLAAWVNATAEDADGRSLAANAVGGSGAGPLLHMPVEIALRPAGEAARVRVEVTMLGSPGTAWLDDVDVLVVPR